MSDETPTETMGETMRRRRGRPRKTETAAAGPALITLTPEQFAALVGNKGDSDEFLKKQALYQAEANKKVLRPENEQAPGISVYSHPEGDRAHPKPPLKCKMFWVGYPLDTDTLTPQEVDLLNLIEDVGTFTFHRTDGSVDKFTIEGEKDAHGRWQRLLFHFKCQGQDKHNLPSMGAMLAEVLAAGAGAQFAAH